MDSILLAIAAGGIGLVGAALLAMRVLKQPQGNEEVREIGALIQEGSAAFLKKEYSILAVFVVIITVILALFIDYNVLDNSMIASLGEGGAMTSQGPWTAIAYVLGAIGSGLAGFIGMSIAVRGNTRTATAAETGLNKALQVAFSTGAVMGEVHPPRRGGDHVGARRPAAAPPAPAPGACTRPHRKPPED